MPTMSLDSLPIELSDKIFERVFDHWPFVIRYAGNRKMLALQMSFLRLICRRFTLATPFFAELAILMRRFACKVTPSLSKFVDIVLRARPLLDILIVAAVPGDMVPRACVKLDLRTLRHIEIDVGRVDFPASERAAIWLENTLDGRDRAVESVCQAITRTLDRPRDGDALIIRFDVLSGTPRDWSFTDWDGEFHNGINTVTATLRGQADGTWRKIECEESHHVHRLGLQFCTEMRGQVWLHGPGFWVVSPTQGDPTAYGDWPFPCECRLTHFESFLFIWRRRLWMDVRWEGRMLKNMPAWS